MLLLSRFKIYGHSMEPTLVEGQTVLVSSIPFFFSKPKVGDIVVVRHSGKRGADEGTHRLVHPEGASIADRRGSSSSRISPSPLPSPLEGEGEGEGASRNDGENNKYLIKRITKTDREKYFVSGDNEKDSMDSRKFGWITKANILGKVVLC